MKIDSLLDVAYDNTIEQIISIKIDPENRIFRTTSMIKEDFNSYLNGYMNYYSRVLEGN